MRDARIEALPRDRRTELGLIWAERARSELGAGSGFAQVLVGLYAVGAVPEVLRLCADANAQELAHAESCRALAELYLGEPVTMPRAKKVSMPPHRGATDPIRAHLHAIGLSCMNETVAADFVARCLDASEVDVLREATSRHLRDEVGHARVGWAHLGSGALDASDRARVAEHLPRLVRANASLWRRRLLLLPERPPSGHGYPLRRELWQGVLEAFERLVIAGLAEARFDVSECARALALTAR
jgi:hypothetical protein